MDRIWQWVWDRYGARYSWAVWAISAPVVLPIYLISSALVVGLEKSDFNVEDRQAHAEANRASPSREA